jgi:predicted nucleic acid-binding Zn ribbon protein
MFSAQKKLYLLKNKSVVNQMTVNCDICRTDISRFFGKNPMGLCEDCHVKVCPKCLQKNKKCQKCGNSLVKTKSIMKEVPVEWKTKPCPSCGKRLDLHARFCDGCGLALNQSGSKNSKKNKCILLIMGIFIVVIIILALELNA